MQRDQLEEFIHKFLNGTATPEEEATLNEWYNEQLKKGSMEWMAADFEERTHLQAEMLKVIQSRLKIVGMKKLKGRLWLRVAAVVTVLIALSIGVHFLTSQKPEMKMAVNTIASKDSIVPGANSAVLTLSNGQQFNLNSVVVGKITRQQNVSVAKTQDGQIIFKYDSSVKSNSRSRLPATTLNNISTPRGGKYQVDLPDGTRVWLNAASSLSFPTVFSGKTRTVKLDGEAYFEVAKNPNFPFVVVSRNQKVKVLGTHFNISAYSDEQVFKTTLLEGKVEVSSGSNRVVIKPGQQTSLRGSDIKVADVDPAEAIDWKNGFIELDHEDIYEIMKKISRWYDVEVIYKGNISNIRFGGSVSRSADISKILAVLEATGAVHFKIEKRRIIVM